MEGWWNESGDDSDSSLNIETDGSKVLGGIFLIIGFYWVAFFMEQAIAELFFPYQETEWIYVILPVIMGILPFLFLGYLGVFMSSSSFLKIDPSRELVSREYLFYGKRWGRISIKFSDIKRVERSIGSEATSDDMGSHPQTYLITESGQIDIPEGKRIAEILGVPYVDMSK